MDHRTGQTARDQRPGAGHLDKVWRPKNDTNTFLGPIRIREALYKSLNLVSIRLLQAMGVGKTID